MRLRRPREWRVRTKLLFVPIAILLIGDGYLVWWHLTQMRTIDTEFKGVVTGIGEKIVLDLESELWFGEDRDRYREILASVENDNITVSRAYLHYIEDSPDLEDSPESIWLPQMPSRSELLFEDPTEPVSNRPIPFNAAHGYTVALDLEEPELPGEEPACIGKLYLAVNTDELDEKKREQTYRSAIPLAITIALGIFLPLATKRLLVDPLRQLLTAMNRAADDYSVRLEVNGNDEVSALAKRFNEMIAEVENRDQELDAAVALRTQELQEKTDSLETSTKNLTEANQRLERRTTQLHTKSEQLEKANQRLERRTDELRTKSDQLEKANGRLDEFVRIVSHDLIKSANHNRVFSEELMTEHGSDLDGDAKELLGMIQESSSWMHDLLESLREYGRVGRDAPDEFDLQASVEQIGRILFPRDSALRSRIRFANRLPVVLCDRVRVTDVFRNLIENGFKYNDRPENEQSVEIGWRESTDDDPVTARAVFYVRDNGIGISDQHDHRTKIFQIFKRLHHRKRYGGGTGVGLSIVKKIVELHGGEIWLESTPGEGTTFFFTLDDGSPEPTPDSQFVIVS